MSAEAQLAWRRSLGEEACRAYAAGPGVVATGVVGSVGRGWADAYSDVEILVVWAEPPSDQMRLDAVKRAGGRIDIDWAEASHDDWLAALAVHEGVVGEMWPYQDDEFAEHFPLRGIPVGVSGFTAATIDGICHQLLVEHRATDDAEMVASSIQDGWDVSGSERLSGWRRRLAEYPIELATRVVMREIDIDPDWWAVDGLAHRTDLTALDAVLLRMRRRIFRILLALNRRYLVDPRPKWARRQIESTPVQPAGAELLWMPPGFGPASEEVERIQELWDATLDLVARHLPGVDVTGARRWFRYRRGPWEPPG